MSVNWIDVNQLSFNNLLLLERVQLSWFPNWLPERALGIALQGNPAVAWFMRHKCPEIRSWLDGVLAAVAGDQPDPAELRAAELAVMARLNDLLTYAVDPAVYDAQAFTTWDDRILTGRVEFAGRTVLDVGAGTGRLALVAAAAGAQVVWAVEPVANLRHYMREKARARGLANFYAVDGLIEDIPFPDETADVTLGGHVFGDDPPAEFAELRRVTRPGGMIVLCPGNTDQDDERHDFLLTQGCEWSRFEEPGYGIVRLYWLRV